MDRKLLEQAKFAFSLIRGTAQGIDPSNTADLIFRLSSIQQKSAELESAIDHYLRSSKISR